eukprot:snap_masked-scaffold_2-processed-gene-26.33-mRNA-1 protein AED:1.00 eAED:1.00 QI:0/0/0/0/1/1/2/0/83
MVIAPCVKPFMYSFAPDDNDWANSFFFEFGYAGMLNAWKKNEDGVMTRKILLDSSSQILVTTLRQWNDFSESKNYQPPVIWAN